MMSINSKLSRPTASRSVIGMAMAAISFFAFSLLASNAVAAPTVQTQETSSRVDLRNSSFAPGAKPQASAKVKRCVVSRFYDGRRIVFSGRMTRFSDTNAPQTLQMKFDVFRKLREHRRYKKVAGTGLGEWLPASDPAATVYVRELALEGVETAAHYRARVTYRWLSSDGSVEFKRVKTTKPCHQRIGLPNLLIETVKSQPVAGSASSNYVVTVSNRGASEAINVPVSLTVDSAVPSMGLIASLGPNQSVDLGVQAPLCRLTTSVVIDPSRLVRLKTKTRLATVGSC